MSELYFAATDDGIAVLRRDRNVWEVVRRDLRGTEVTAVSVAGSHVLAGTTAGVWRSENLGETWRSVNEGLEVEHVRWLAHHPAYPSFAFVGTEPAALFRSEDGGLSWTGRPEVVRLRDENGWYLPYSPEAGCIRGFAFHGERGYAAVEQGGLLWSDNRGRNWRPAEGSIPNPNADRVEGYIHPDVHSVNVHPSSADLVVAPTGGGLYRSDDGGRVFQRLYRCYCRAVWLDPGNADHMIFGPADGVSRNGRIEETLDGGASWRPASAGLETPWAQYMVERFVSDGERLLAVLSNGELLTTSLKVIDWQQILPDLPHVNAIAVASG
jgi:photosystem II stability/assembly factor-like uncharacterized protein